MKVEPRNAVSDALRYIPSTDRRVWINVGNALKTTFGDDGFALWCSWSATASNYDARIMDSQWRSLRPGKVTIGTVFRIAASYGFDKANASPEHFRSNVHTRDVRKRTEQAEKKRAADEERARKRAQYIHMRSFVKPGHPYMIRKGFPTMPVATWKDKVVVPVQDTTTREIVNVQMIDADGGKIFLKGGRVRDTFHIVGKGPELWACEGYATALSISAARRLMGARPSVAVLWSDGGIRRVAAQWKAVLLVADHDRYRCKACDVAWDDYRWPTETFCRICGEVAIKAAGPLAARSTGLRWWMPPKHGDANDLHVERGLPDLAERLEMFVTGVPASR